MLERLAGALQAAGRHGDHARGEAFLLQQLECAAPAHPLEARVLVGRVLDPADAGCGERAAQPGARHA